MAASFEFDASQRRITAHGEVDLASGRSLTELFASIAQGDGTEPLSLDMGHVAFIDSAGLRAVVDEALRRRQDGAELRITNPSAQVRRLIEIVGLTEVLCVADDAEV